MPDSTLARKRAVHVLLPLFIGSVIAYLDRVNLAYAGMTMNKELAFSETVFGTGAGIFFVGYVFFEVPGALIAERWSPRLWLARIMITWGLVSALMAFIKTPGQFYAVRFLLGAAEASFYPVAYASVIPRWFAPEERPRAIAGMLTSLQVSQIVGSPFAGWLLGTSLGGLHGWQVLFLAEAVPAVIFGMVLLYWLADWPRQVSWLTEREKQWLADQYTRDLQRKSAAHSCTVGRALRDPEVLKLCAIYFLWITGFWGFGYWTPRVLQELTHWSPQKVGWMMTIPMALSLAGMVAAGRSASRTGEKRWHGAVPVFLGAAGMAIGAFAKEPLLYFLSVCLAGVGVYGAFGVWWSYPTSFLSGAAAAGAVGLINSFGNTGGYVGPSLFGIVRDATGSFEGAYIGLAASLFLSGLLMLTLGRGRSGVPDA